MPKYFRACNRTLPSLQSCHNKSSVWISDDLLNEALHRYLYIQKRGGSSVPGPLEARRRASKRKNTNLAYQAGQGGSVDVGVLFGPGKQQQWWNGQQPEGRQDVAQDAQYRAGTYNPPSSFHRPRESHNRHLPKKQFLPFWMTGGRDAEPSNFPGILEATSTQQEVVGQAQPVWLTLDGSKADSFNITEVVAPVAHLDIAAEESTFNANVSRARSVEGIKKLLGSTTSSRRYRTALQHTLNNDFPISEIDDLLQARASCCPWQKSYLQIMQHLSRVSDHRCPDLLQSLYLGVENDRINEDELRSVFDQLTHILLPGKTSTQDRASRLQTIYEKLLLSVEQSNSLTWNSIPENTMKKIVDLSVQASLHECNIALPRLLLRMWPTHYLQTLPKLVLQWVDLACLEAATARSKSATNGQVTAFLEELDSNTFADVISSTSQSLIESAARNASDAGKLYTWVNILRRLSLAGSPSSHNWPVNAADGGSSSLSPRQAIFVRMWTISQISANYTDPRSIDVCRPVLHDLIERFQKLLPPAADLKEMLLLTAQSLPIRSASLLETLSEIAFPDSEPMKAPTTIHLHLSSFLADHLSAIQDDATYKTHKAHLHNALSAMSERINLNLPQFDQYAKSLIKHDKLSMKIVTRLLTTNTPFKLALSMGGNPVHRTVSFLSAAQDKSSVSRGGKRSTPPPLHLASHQTFGEQCLNTVHSLAYAFATSPAISPRQAYRKVRWVYLFMHRHGGPILPEMTRALHHAAITRYKQAGLKPVPEQAMWVWNKIAEVEGPEMAQSLKRWGDPGYRQSLLGKQVEERDDYDIARRVMIERPEVLIRKFLV